MNLQRMDADTAETVAELVRARPSSLRSPRLCIELTKLQPHYG
jgi:hypothetical protein